jgi:hypothetical protein
MRTFGRPLGRGVCPGSTPSLDSLSWGYSNDGAKIDPVLRPEARRVHRASACGRKGLNPTRDRPRVFARSRRLERQAHGRIPDDSL